MNPQRDNFKRAFSIEITLLALFVLTFLAHVLGLIPEALSASILGTVALIGLIPVTRSAWESIKEKKINVDLLATIALFFSFIAHEWGSVLFINMMLTSARIL